MFMKRRLSVLILIAITSVAPCLLGQSATPKPRVVLAKLGPVDYPVIARTAHISGDVGVDLEVRRDGTVERATAVSGPPLLYRVALQSAQESLFECRNCTEARTSYKLLYTFKLVDNPDHGNCPGAPSPTGYPPGQIFPVVKLAENHVTVVDLAPPCIADNVFAPHKVRSWKCLYLWRCGRR